MKRTKRRYIALQIDGSFEYSDWQVIDSVWLAVTKLFGEYGASMANLALIKYDSKKKFAVLRSNLNSLDNVRTALASITSIENKPVAMHVLQISGTIKALIRKTRS